MANIVKIYTNKLKFLGQYWDQMGGNVLDFPPTQSIGGKLFIQRNIPTLFDQRHNYIYDGMMET